MDDSTTANSKSITDATTVLACSFIPPNNALTDFQANQRLKVRKVLTEWQKSKSAKNDNDITFDFDFVEDVQVNDTDANGISTSSAPLRRPTVRIAFDSDGSSSSRSNSNSNKFVNVSTTTRGEEVSGPETDVITSKLSNYQPQPSVNINKNFNFDVNLGWIDGNDDVPSPSETSTILHEFGHALSMMHRHEHEAPARGRGPGTSGEIALKDPAAIRSYTSTVGQTDDEVRSRILDIYNQQDVSTFSDVDCRSIMQFFIPPSEGNGLEQGRKTEPEPER